QLFSNLHNRWFPPPPGFEESFQESVQGYIKIEEALRRDENLRKFSRSLYPELGQDLDQFDGEGRPGGRPEVEEGPAGEGASAEGKERREAQRFAAELPQGEQGGANEEGEEERVARRCAELHLVSQMLQVMEDVWLSLHLEGY